MFLNLFCSQAKKKQEVDSLSDFESLSSVAQVFLTTTNYNYLIQEVVESVLKEIEKLGHEFDITVLGLVTSYKGQKVIRRTSITTNKTSKNLRASTHKKFEDMITPLTADSNYCVKALKNRKFYITHDLYDMVHPPFSREEVEKQKKASGIQTSVVFPIVVQDKAVGIFILGTKRFIKELSQREIAFIQSLTGIIGIAVQNSKLFEQVEKDKIDLQKANEKLKKIDSLKDEFVSVASHELRTPMTAIKNYLWLALNEESEHLNQKLKKQINIAYNSTERLITLVNDMLTVSRIDSGSDKLDINKKPENLNNLAEEIYNELLPIAQQKKINFQLNKNNDPIIINVDKKRILQILQNLIGNALKFTPQNGSITMTSEIINNQAYFHVTDNGPGISPENIKKLFTKFTRLEHSYQKIKEAGTGLGLYICQQLAQLHGGKINVESQINQGSTFTLILPLKNETNN